MTGISHKALLAQKKRREENYAIMDALIFKQPPDDETAAFRVQELVNDGHEVTAFQSIFEKTALFVAVENNWPRTCRVLLENNPDPRWPYWESSHGQAALHCAAPMGNIAGSQSETSSLEAVKVLIEEFNIDPRMPNRNGDAPSAYAHASGDSRLAEYLEAQEARFAREDRPFPPY